MPPVTYFDIDTDKLSSSEKEVLAVLEKVGEDLHALWVSQHREDGSLTSYPEGITKEELLKASEKDPDILRSDTVIVQEDGGLRCIPYSEYFSDQLEPIYEGLEKAASLSQDSQLKVYIEEFLAAFRKGDREGAMVAFLSNTPKIEFLLGPIETYEDDVLGVKATYQYNLRVMLDDSTNDITEMARIMEESILPQPETSVGISRGKAPVSVRIDAVRMFSGRQAGKLVSSTNLPNEADLLSEHGSKILVYTTSMYKKYDERLAPYLGFYNSGEKKDEVEDMKLANSRLITLHELAEATVKFDGSPQRLGVWMDFVRELNADVFGVNSAKYFVLNGLITEKEYQNILLAFVVFAVDVCNEYMATGGYRDYAIGFAVAFNLFEKSCSITFSNDGIEVDYTKLSSDVKFLSDLTVKILETGEESDAEKLVDEYGDTSIFDRLPTIE